MSIEVLKDSLKNIYINEDNVTIYIKDFIK